MRPTSPRAARRFLAPVAAAAALAALVAGCANTGNSAGTPRDSEAIASRSAASPFPAGGLTPTSLITLDMAKMSSAEQVAAAALQGMLARTSQTQLFILNSASQPDGAALWLQQSKLPSTACDCESGTHSAGVFWAWMAKMDSVSKNYILYDWTTHQDSVNSATSLAGICSAIPVDASVVTPATAAGFKQSQDASSLSVPDLISQYGNGAAGGCAATLTKNIAFELSSNPNTGVFAGGPRDLAVMNNAIVFYDDDGNSTSNLTSVLGYVTPPSPIMGWGNTSNSYGSEFPFIDATGGAGDFYVAADWARNLSALSGLASTTAIKPAKQPPARSTALPTTNPIQPTGSSPASATFLMSDGDNLQWLLNRGDSGAWWGSSVRGTVPIGWTTSPALSYLAPTAWNYYATTAKASDEFVGGPSGIGYEYGNAASQTALFNDQLADLNAFANQMNIHTVGVFGYGDWSNSDYLTGFLNQPDISGAFYFEFEGWIPVESGYTTQWLNNKPMIPANEYLTNLTGDSQSVQSVGNDVCTANKNDNIYAIYVNAWGNSNNPMPLIQGVQQYVQNNCPGAVNFVLPSQLVTNAAAAHTNSAR